MFMDLTTYVHLLNVNQLVAGDINFFPNPSLGIIHINNLNRDYSMLTISNINGSVIQILPIDKPRKYFCKN